MLPKCKEQRDAFVACYSSLPWSMDLPNTWMEKQVSEATGNTS